MSNVRLVIRSLGLDLVSSEPSGEPLERERPHYFPGKPKQLQVDVCCSTWLERCRYQRRIVISEISCVCPYVFLAHALRPSIIYWLVWSDHIPRAARIMATDWHRQYQFIQSMSCITAKRKP
ncbi:hypothetical protein P171DRAFT_180485 [Karstenula rhodostoma CBS 690.94]|uniref:Uncharacterized protein n=1 Tax=Karstenula rhodostoma CBS 690.94 TaxID=1392251 RepID=A0A9P4P4X9_9PLEO|nr:hypothetical protein P171DRAFT_180485 [Karstenula rhodostoma CBS 690.94]